MLDSTLLKSLLNYGFFTENRTNLTENLFNGEYKDLFRALKKGHEKYAEDLSSHDLQALWVSDNPVATRAESGEIADLLTEIDNSPSISPAVASDLLSELWMRSWGLKVSNLGVEITQGSKDAVERLKDLMSRAKDGMMPSDFGDPTTMDIDTLLQSATDEGRFKFNLNTLSRNIYGIGRKEFMAVFALPETGKSAFVVSLACGPDGFCQQGAKVLLLGNEEDTGRTMLRAMQCWGGMTLNEVISDPKLARQKFSQIEDNIEMRDIQEWDLAKIESYIEHGDFDIVILDQGDKIQLGGNSFNNSHERLRELYRRLRELAKRQDVALITVSQASNEARGRTKLSGFDMEGSKIGKMAELDVCIGIAKQESSDVEDSEIDFTRYVTVSKNKLSGWHGTVICNLEPAISRYVE